MNKRETLFLSIVLLLSLDTFVFAQNSNHSGYLVLNTGDTIPGKVRYFNERRVTSTFYKRIRITDTNGKRKKYRRKKVLSFKVDGFDYESFWLSQPPQSFPRVSLDNPRYDIDFKKGEQHFLKVVSKGELSHYELEWINEDDNDLWSMDLLKKEEDHFFIKADMGFLGLRRKVLKNYFFNCPKIKELIERKQLKKVRQVVKFYNDSCID